MQRTPSLKGIAPAAACVLMVLMIEARARADDGGVTTLAANDFALTLARTENGKTTTLTADEVATYFSVARCACPTSIVATLTLDPTAAANLGTHAVSAQLVVGNDCNDAAATGCTAVGSSLTLSAQKLVTSASVATSAVFAAAARADCASTSTSTRLWAVVRLDGTRIDTQPSLALTLGGAGPKAPTAVTTQIAENGLLVSWKAADDVSRLRGHQVLCLPGPTKAVEATYDSCPAARADGGVSPFASLEPQYVCSGLVAPNTSSVRVGGLENGRAYRIAVVAVGVDGTPSPPSADTEGTPGPTVGFDELYTLDGGAAQMGCATGGGGTPDAAVFLAGGALVAWAARRRRGRTLGLVVAGGLALGASEARAATESPSAFELSIATPIETTASPHQWNIELRFGPYLPDVDQEFIERGDPSRPFTDIFTSSQRLMSQVEIDRQLSQRGGTWALGVGVGYYRATAAALTGDLKSRSGDQTSLRLVPLSAALVHRADLLRSRLHSPLVPYVKAGLDCTLWRAGDTSKASVSGRTFGWHGAAGVTLDLAMFDPESARTMDIETGVNQAALFFEVASYHLDGFGSRSALHLGDTTWFAGLMLEL